MSHWGFTRPADEEHDPLRPSWPDGTTGGDGAAASPHTYRPDQFDVGLPPLAVASREPFYPWPPAPYPAAGRGAAQDTAPWALPGGGRRGPRRLMIPAGLAVVAVVAAALVTLTGGHPGARGTDSAGPAPAESEMRATTRASASPSPGAAAGAPLTLGQAQSVLARYTAANNSANGQRSGALLATVETGSSFAIDASMYQAGAATIPAFSPVQATYYIPCGEPASGPRWFVVQVADALQLSPSDVASDGYLLFTQPAPGGPWQDAIEPYLLPAASAPQVAVGNGGLAAAVSPSSASVTVAPGQLPAVTAASLDGKGATTGGGHAAIANPGRLADFSDVRLRQAEAPGATVTDSHAPATGADGQEFALLTTNGGALVFYTDQAEVTVTFPARRAGPAHARDGHAPAQAKAPASTAYLEQFATYDPPAGGGVPRVVADYSGSTSSS